MKKRSKKKRSLFAKIIIGLLLAVLAVYLVLFTVIFSLRYFNPPVTVVQIQRQFAAERAHHKLQRHYLYVPLNRIAPDLRYAVVAAENARFYIRHGFDWVELQKVVRSDVARKRLG